MWELLAVELWPTRLLLDLMMDHQYLQRHRQHIGGALFDVQRIGRMPHAAAESHLGDQSKAQPDCWGSGSERLGPRRVSLAETSVMIMCICPTKSLTEWV
jgi:hypothetical protein